MSSHVTTYPWASVVKLRRRDVSSMRRLRAYFRDGPAAVLRWSHALGIDVSITAALTATAHVGFHSVSFTLRSTSGARALVTVDESLVAAILAATLSVPGEPALGPASAGERGLVAYTLASLLAELEAGSEWSVILDPLSAPQRPTHEAPGESTTCAATVSFGGRKGTAWLSLDLDEIALRTSHAQPPSWCNVGRLRRLPISAHCIIQRFALPLLGAQRLAAGDTIVTPLPESQHSVAVQIGSGWFPGMRDGSQVKLTGPFQRGKAAMPNHDDTIAEHLAVEVCAEIGRITLSGAEAMNLAEGDVLTLDKPLGAPLELRIGNQLLARGELVNVDGETGIRLLEVYE